MAMLDVNLAVTETLFQSRYSVIRQKETVGDDGIARIATSIFNNLSGVIFPKGGSMLHREPGYAITPKLIGVCGTFFLYAESAVAGTVFQPDLVNWNGNNYVVKHLDDYSNYGGGFVYATCSLTDYLAVPPGAPVIGIPVPAPPVTVTGDSPVAGPGIIMIDSTGGPLTLILPDATLDIAKSGSLFMFKMVAGTATAFIVPAVPTQTIDGLAMVPLIGLNSSMSLASDGTKWMIMQTT